jgi:hypothetical protein
MALTPRCSEPNCQRPYAHVEWHWNNRIWWIWIREFDNQRVKVIKSTAVDAWDYQQGRKRVPEFN